MSGGDWTGQGPKGNGAGGGCSRPHATGQDRAHKSRARPPRMRKRALAQLRLKRFDTGQELSLTGRVAQTLEALHRLGSAGATSGELSPLGWARRTSAYVHTLRRHHGLDISGTLEAAGDAVVMRYRLETPVTILSGEAQP